MKHSAKKRKQRLRKLEENIKEEGSIEEKKVYAEASYDWGMTKRTCQEYLETLENLGRIQIENGSIEYVGDDESNE